MTNEEAIHVINQVRDVITKDPSWMEEATRVVNEAADMAIKALEAQEQLSNKSPKVDKESGELISREAANSKICNACGMIDCDQMDKCEKLFTAQDEKCNSSNILRYPQCVKRTKLGNCDTVGGFCTSVPKEMCDTQEHEKENITDTISRKAAIDALDCINGVEEVLRSLPSAQPEPIRINLNEPIKVKLTDWGKEIYYHQYDRTNQIAGREICKPRFPREDENGYTEFQLWCFIELYGMHMGMTLPNVIEPLEIVYER